MDSNGFWWSEEQLQCDEWCVSSFQRVRRWLSTIVLRFTLLRSVWRTSFFGVVLSVVCVFPSRCESGAFFVSSFSILVPMLPRICLIRPVSAVLLLRIQLFGCFVIVPFGHELVDPVVSGTSSIVSVECYLAPRQVSRNG